jgi:hypothetical protein
MGAQVRPARNERVEVARLLDDADRHGPRTRALEEMSRSARQRLGAIRDAGLDAGFEDQELQRLACLGVVARLHWLISMEWRRLAARNKGPLVYVFGGGFGVSVVEHHEIPREQIARVCALLACGQRPECLGVHPLPGGEGGDAQQRVRADGASAFGAWLSSDAPGGPGATCVYFWCLKETVEFASLGPHNDLSLPRA